VPLAPENRLPNVTVLSVAPVFGEAIRRNVLRESIGDLFAFGEDPIKVTQDLPVKAK
jgi:hypothetical protein